jgi:hypothetical protein
MIELAEPNHVCDVLRDLEWLHARLDQKEY